MEKPLIMKRALEWREKFETFTSWQELILIKSTFAEVDYRLCGSHGSLDYPLPFVLEISSSPILKKKFYPPFRVSKTCPCLMSFQIFFILFL